MFRAFSWGTAVGGSPVECGVGGQSQTPPHFHPRHRSPPVMTLQRRARVRFNRLRTSVGRFRSCLYKWVWPPLRPVSVAKTNKPSTMLSSNVQSIELPMDRMALRLWMMR